MNLQQERIQDACATLKLGAISNEWPAVADKLSAQEGTFADFLEQVLKLELQARTRRTQETLLKFAGFLR